MKNPFKRGSSPPTVQQKKEASPLIENPFKSDINSTQANLPQVAAPLIENLSKTSRENRFSQPMSYMAELAEVFSSEAQSKSKTPEKSKGSVVVPTLNMGKLKQGNQGDASSGQQTAHNPPLAKLTSETQDPFAEALDETPD